MCVLGKEGQKAHLTIKEKLYVHFTDEETNTKEIE